MPNRLFFFLLLITVLPFRVSSSDDPLAEKAAMLHRRMVTIDSHNDTPLRMQQEGFNMAIRHDPYTEYSKVDFPRMAEGGLDGAFFAVFVSQGPRNEPGYARVLKKGMALFDTIDHVVERSQELAGKATTPEDILNLKKEDRRAVFIGVENGYLIGRDLSLISTLYLRGARYITLCHTKNNDICDSSTDTTEHDGLSVFGREVITEMNHVGMMIDISHASDKTVKDILKMTEAPVIASHSCARAICDNPRNLSDDLLKAIAENGGVVQMCILSDYVKTPPPNPARDSARRAVREKYRGFEGLSDEEMKAARKEWNEMNRLYPAKLAIVPEVADHIDHMVKVAGINHVGIGTDFDGGGGVEGCFDAGETKNITIELLRRGYSNRDIQKIWGKNLMRVMRRVTKTADKYKASCRCS